MKKKQNKNNKNNKKKKKNKQNRIRTKKHTPTNIHPTQQIHAILQLTIKIPTKQAKQKIYITPNTPH